MFVSEELKNHLETSSTIKTEAAVIAEWNMNIAGNVAKIGNYRYRPLSPQGSTYRNILESFDINDAGYFYTNATDSDATIDGGIDEDEVPIAFKSSKDKEKLLYSLEDCLGRFRPRSGINKIRYFGDNSFHHTNVNMAQRPRYYMADKNDKFKYWTSYRTESEYIYLYNDGTSGSGYDETFIDKDGTEKLGTISKNTVERGVANKILGGQNYIDDAAPFVVYKDKVPANRIIVKMQTNVGDIDLGPFKNEEGDYPDPFFGEENKTVPVNWKIQYLQDNNWVDAVKFNQTSFRANGSPIIGNDGYVELAYGLIVPEEYRAIFVNTAQYASNFFLPEEPVSGSAFLIKENAQDVGIYYIWVTDHYETFVPEYGWYLSEEGLFGSTSTVTEFVSPPEFINPATGQLQYMEFQYIQGIRVVATTMSKINSTFDLIEFSPRLVADLTNRVAGYGISKDASDLGVSGMPVAQLLASVGGMTVFDYDNSFNQDNNNSIIKDYVTRNLQIKIYEIIKEVNDANYYLPIKTMYVEGFPEIDDTDRTVSLAFRDLFFYFESITAPELLIQSASLSYAVSLLLDSIGFSNYVFLRTEDEDETIIPYFFVGPDRSVAQVLQDLAISTQTAMFFDEYNNFICMSKNYMMPTEDQRPTDIVLYGSNDFEKSGVVNNETTNPVLANVAVITSRQNNVFNAGKIMYTNRYIQRSYSSIRQANLIDKDKRWVYKPALLWEVAPSQNTKSINDEINSQSAYALTAIPLNSDLSSDVPTVVNHQLVNNILDLGEAIYWIARYNGYFYANGEVIKYDAVQYNVPNLAVLDNELVEVQDNNVWISSLREYQYYFSKLPFNGKLYPTGLVRIYSEPKYEVIDGVTRLKNGEVEKHGRGQFGTKIVAHTAGIDPYWSDNNNVRGCNMTSGFLFSPFVSIEIPDVKSETAIGPAVLSVPLEYQSAIFIGQELKRISGSGNISGQANGSRSSTKSQNRQTSNDDSEKEEKDSRPKTTVTELGSVIEVMKDGKVDQRRFTFTISSAPTAILKGGLETIYEFKFNNDDAVAGPAGVNNTLAAKSTRNGIIKNYLSSSFITENEANRLYATQTGTVQSSALVMNGPTFEATDKPLDFVTYVYKQLNDRFKHFGTRVRIIGKLENLLNRSQTPIGGQTYYTLPTEQPDVNITIGGASAGITVLVNPTTNNGYYFEIAALSEEDTNGYATNGYVGNVFFYKIKKDKLSDKAIPIRLWSGSAKIIVDSGQFTGQGRMAAEENPTVYDLGVDYEDIGNKRIFYLYINNNKVATVVDDDPLPDTNNNGMGLFVRGTSRAMFENVYAITNNYAQNTSSIIEGNTFDDDEISVNEAFRKYALSGILQSTYLSGINPAEPPKYSIYFDEFGTIMREAAYFNVKYDKAYPALYAKMSPTFNRLRGYTVSGFTAGAYGAEFLIFNATDTVLNLDETSGNYLRIQGITFTQSSSQELTVDDFFERLSNFSDPEYSESGDIISPQKFEQALLDIKASRINYGKNEFTLDAPYVQTQDEANNLMEWMISKIMTPRRSFGLRIFANPMIQLGDIAQINYKDKVGSELISSSGRFVVYKIEYNRGNVGPEMLIYLSEVK